MTDAQKLKHLAQHHSSALAKHFNLLNNVFEEDMAAIERFCKNPFHPGFRCNLSRLRQKTNRYQHHRNAKLLTLFKAAEYL